VFPYRESYRTENCQLEIQKMIYTRFNYGAGFLLRPHYTVFVLHSLSKTLISDINRYVDEDIKKVLDRADHYRFEEDESSVFLNPISALPTSKKRLKKSLVERITMLIDGYCSLATFVPDETIEYMEKNPKSTKTRNIYLGVLDDMEKLRKEVLAMLK
jgi:hypothetical protein